jgi:hypothetical protein
MSWNCNLVIDTGGPSPATIEIVRSVTYNNSKIFLVLDVHPTKLNSMLAKDAIPLIENALLEYPSKIDQLLNTFTGFIWGGPEDARDFLSDLLNACKRHPKANIQFD